MAQTEADIVIVGGGLTGCAVASRLKQADPSLSIILLEAGSDATGDPRTISPMAGFALARTEMDWQYVTQPQVHLNGRRLYGQAGKVLGGGSTVNYGGWARGDATDYDQWSRIVGDDRWSFQSLLPYFKKSETFLVPKDAPIDKDLHGFLGPIKCTSVSNSNPERRYGLRQPLFNAWSELGFSLNYDGNSGNIAGITEIVENWHDGVRQPSHIAYQLDGVNVITSTMVQKVLFENSSVPIASGVLTTKGKTIKAKKLVIVSTGAQRTPQLLMLSGIGPSSELSQHGITTLVNNEEVGANYFDHFSLFQWWKLKKPEKVYAVGSPNWKNPALFKGVPSDWTIKESVPAQILDEALKHDGVDEVDAAAYLAPGRSHLETTMIYLPGPAPAVGLNLPVDGTYVCTATMLNLPTSRGRVSLASHDPNDPPQLDPNFFATAVDRSTLAYGAKRAAQALLETKVGQEYFEEEVTPPGTVSLGATSTKEDFEQRIKAVGMPFAHAAGTAAMGKVVDSKLNVLGVQRLKVVDYSILPTPISSRPMATLYGIAEVAAEIILQELHA